MLDEDVRSKQWIRYWIRMLDQDARSGYWITILDQDAVSGYGSQFWIRMLIQNARSGETRSIIGILHQETGLDDWIRIIDQENGSG